VALTVGKIMQNFEDIQLGGAAPQPVEFPPHGTLDQDRQVGPDPGVGEAFGHQPEGVPHPSSGTSDLKGCKFTVGAVGRHDGDGKIRVVVVRTLGFLIVSRLAGLFGLGPSSDARDVEIAVLRHQLAVLGRQVARPRYAPSDRMLLAVLARLLPRDRWRVVLVTPSTLLRWHRELVARRWTYPATGRSRRGLPGATVELVVRLARENPRWGYVRIVGETRKLGVTMPSSPAPACRW
jgi:hypothetical protein